jgi:hypothetical protein
MLRIVSPSRANYFGGSLRRSELQVAGVKRERGEIAAEALTAIDIVSEESL